MARLESPLSEKINSIYASMNKLYDEGNYLKAIEVLQEGWDELPNPKESFDESFHIAKYIIEFALDIKDFELAKKWVSTLRKCGLERVDVGERDLLEGKVLFESGEVDSAIPFFKLANIKSKGRLFSGEDKKYKKLIIV